MIRGGSGGAAFVGVAAVVAGAGCGRIGFDPSGGAGGAELTVIVEGDGAGTITSSPPGIDCPGSCTAAFSPGVAVTLTAAPAGDHSFAGWSALECVDSSDCQVTLVADRSVRGRFHGARNFVFLTSTAHVTGAIGGLSQADAICGQRAAEAGLPGTYVAWLSTAAEPAPSRLGSASGWIRPDGLPVANSVDDFLLGGVRFPVVIDEGGQLVVGDMLNHDIRVATGTMPTGMVGNNCADYVDVDVSVTIGEASGAGRLFTFSGGNACSTAHRLYCFGVDLAAPVDHVVHEGRTVFLAPDWTPSGGLAGADAYCNQEASQAGLAGTFRAVLATSTATAAERLPAGEEPWVRPDGVVVAASRSAVVAETLLAPISVYADGTSHTTARTQVWSGAATPTELGDAGTDTCGDWQDSSGGVLGRTGNLTASANSFGDGGGSGCNSVNHLYCVQDN